MRVPRPWNKMISRCQYHLVLNPQAERRDSYYRITPRGTLLVWIDRFLSNPASPQQFTAGRNENFGTPFVYDTPLDLKPQIYLKVFRGAPHLSKSEPQHHGGFADDFPFWTTTFRTPAVRHKGCQDATALPSMTTR